MSNKIYSVYILSSFSKVLYIGVTNDLKRRIYEHQQGMIEGFTKKYKVKQLVYYELFKDILLAIEREKQLKRWNRLKKIQLIHQQNPDWQDLSLQL